MHLIRARSEALDTLSLRIHWESQRLEVWDGRGRIIEGLRNFVKLSTWTTSVYETTTRAESSKSGSIPSKLEDLYPGVLSADARTRRRHASDQITTEFQTLTTQLANFRRNVFPIPGVTLDKMIETSSKKIPDEILDVQDALENVNQDLNILDKFAMGVRGQWKK